MSADQLVVRLDSPLPAALPAGRATALFCIGTAWEGGLPVPDLEFGVNGAWTSAAAVAMPRRDMPCRRSGFWGVVPVPASNGPSIELAVRVRLRDGGLAERRLGSLPVTPREEHSSRASEAASGLIAVCLATFNPDPDLLRRQLDSLRGQSDRHWLCAVSDDCSDPARFAELRAQIAGDKRFILSRSERRIGFYRNFERALGMAPPEAELIAFCDQDDVWHPDKLAVLRSSLGNRTLVYSDQRLVDREGRVLRETLWQGRANNQTNLASMLVANTVTGAAALFRREVAERALPFPDSPGIEFHDHWIALVALACGELGYVNRPLYDYVQHEAAVLGQVVGRSLQSRRGAWKSLLSQWRAAYFLGYVPGQVRAQTLLVRCDDRLGAVKRAGLRRYLAADSSVRAFLWLVLRPLRALAGRTETLGGEWELARGVVWFALARWLAARRWLPARLTADARFPDPPNFQFRRLQRWRSRV